MRKTTPFMAGAALAGWLAALPAVAQDAALIAAARQEGQVVWYTTLLAAQLAEPMAVGEKPRENWRIGTEHEKLVFSTGDHHAPSYDEPGGIRDLLMAMTEFGWKPVEEGGKVIAMSGSDGAISLEPAGQLDL